MFRVVPTLVGTAPEVDVRSLPDDPVVLFYEWFAVALEAGVSEPSAATLSTVDENGLPDSRVLIVRDVDDRGWAFAGPASSRKGQQLASQSAAALSIWWQPLVRAVRVRGPVVEASREDCEADLALRSESARAGVAAGDWRLWRIEPSRIEFWQGATDRRHLRIVYSYGDGWDLSVVRGGEEVER